MNSRNRQAAAIARDIFGAGGTVQPLPGELDLNFRVSGPGGDIVLKLGPASRRPILDLVISCLYHLEASRFRGPVPRVVPPSGTTGAPEVAYVTFEGAPSVACALTWMPGTPLADLRPSSPAVLEALGALLARLNGSLEDFEHPALDRDMPWRLEVAAVEIDDNLHHLDRGHDLVEVTLDRADVLLDPIIDELSGGTIHNDANDFNVLVQPSLEEARLVGLIDFGDVVDGWCVSEAAVAAAYAMMGRADPLEAACAVARGYSSVTPLNEAECRALLPLVAQRLCLSVTVQARQMREQPCNRYLAVSQEGAWRLLEELARTDWRIAEFRIREACGFAPNPRLVAVTSWMEDADERAPVMPPEVLARPHVLDLSVESTDLPHPATAADPRAAQAWIEDGVTAAGATVAVGRYGEARLLYDAPAFHTRGDHGPEARTVHLGLDLFAPAGTPVHAPLAGTVLAVADNDRPLDYGPTVILRHVTPDGDGFHTLYGHLDRDTLDHPSPGDRVAPGDVIGRLGDAAVNGGWPPHLHLQVMALDPLYADGTLPHERGNFPGVARHRLLALWRSVLPDPTALAGLPGGTTTAIAPAADAVLRKRVLNEKRKTVLGSSLSLSYADPIHVVRGLGAHLYDDTGRRYLDAVNNVTHVGHANPRVAAAIARQSRVLNTNTRYLHTEIVALADELLARFPDPLEVLFLVCSGSEANELALRMARRHTGNDGVVCLEGGYHGNTGALVEISHYKFAGPGGDGASDRVVAAAMPDVYRGRFRRGFGVSAGRLGKKYAAEVAGAAGILGDRGHGVAAFVAEPIMGCGGQIEPPPGYLAAAYAHVREAGGVCVADEVQVGFGRVGDAFWAFELQGVVPDIVTLGKPMGNGHPVAAVVTTPEIAGSFANGMEFFSSFGGNPVSCAAARAVLAEIDERELMAHARDMGAGLLKALGELAERHALVGDVRGRGLFLGVEIVRDRETREPFPEACAYIVNRARELGVLLSADGPDHNVLKVKPPMVFGEDDAALLVETLDTILGESALRGSQDGE